MNNNKTVFVTGATGNQGGALTRHLLGRGFRVKALTRDPGSSKARLLAGKQVEIIQGDLNDPATYREHLNSTDAVFCNLHFTAGVEKEIKQGKELISVASEKGTPHLLYSSVVGSDLGTGIPHWESKHVIEGHLRSSGINYSILRPASLFENLLIPAVKSRIEKGKLVLPTRGNIVQQFISSDDIGRVGALIFSDPQKYRGRTITLASEQLDGIQLAAAFSGVMKREIKFQQLPGLIVRLAMGKNLSTMFRWLNRNGGVFLKDIKEPESEFPGMMTVEEWITAHFLQRDPPQVATV